ncbi:MAG: hypothetical protein EXS29_02130 [Pedosphaera sp.]|nr:hypothetical protein [Pedosphaera sp.]
MAIFTSLAGEEIQAQARALGAVECFQKPVDFDKYEQAVCAIASRWAGPAPKATAAEPAKS